MECIIIFFYFFMINGELYGFFKGRKGIRRGDFISFLLFVVCMEYLLRIFSYVINKFEFEFFKGCKSLKLCYLCFTDDLIFFCEGEFYFIFILLRGFEIFFVIFGLVVN